VRQARRGGPFCELKALGEGGGSEICVREHGKGAFDGRSGEKTPGRKGRRKKRGTEGGKVSRGKMEKNEAPCTQVGGSRSGQGLGGGSCPLWDTLRFAS